ncbi:MAG: hypothetical protein ACJ751_13155 [Niastella sp.]|jgi:hypothetical protein|uniref:hypothetical protein n=1 Tax=Niastella sp. TaxID=1869183 RepID=UPI00389B2BC0
MYVLFETIPGKTREFITYENDFHHRMETGAIPLSATIKDFTHAGLQHILALCSRTTILI